MSDNSDNESSYSNNNYWNDGRIEPDHRFFKAVKKGDMAAMEECVDIWDDREENDRYNMDESRFDDYDEDCHEYPRKYPDMKVKDTNGLNAMHIAAQTGQVHVICYMRALLKRPEDWTSDQGHTPVHLAAANGRMAATRILLEGLKMSPNPTPSKYGKAAPQTPLHYAASRDFAKVVALLLQHGADASAKNRDGKTPLEVVDEEKYPEVAKLLREGVPKREREVAAAEEEEGSPATSKGPKTE